MHSAIIIHIRKSVLGVTQHEFAAIAGTTQATVSRWEKGQLGPSLEEAGNIRAEVKRRGHDWSDSWLFEAPSTAPGDDPPAPAHVGNKWGVT